MLESRLDLLRYLLLGLSVLISLTVMVSWSFGWDELIQLNSAWAPMQFNTALCLSILAMAGFIQGFGQQKIARYLFGFVFLFASLSLSEWILDVSWGIDNIFGFQEITTRAPSPGRMSENTALSFVLLSFISLLPRSKGKIINLHAFGIAIVFSLALVSLVSYLTQFEQVYAWNDIAGMAVHTSICFLFISTSFLLRKWRLNVANNKTSSKENEAWLLAILIGLSICLMLVDLHLNDAVFSSPIYCLLILLASYFSNNTQFIYAVGLATLLIMTVAMFIKSSTFSTNVHFADRAMAFAIVIGFTFLMLKTKRTQNKLAALNQNLDQQVKERTRKLQLQNEELRQFTFIASHDLQEPLRTIRTLMGFIEEKEVLKGDSKIEQAFAYVCDAADRMSDLVNALLDYSRLGRTKKTKLVDLNILLADVKVDLNELIQTSRAQIHVKELPTCEVYPVEMRLLFQNLISNAIKFQKKDAQPIIEIWAEDNSTPLKIAIKDNGIGIAPEHQHKVFDLFKRLHSTKKYEGLGIGLAHCKKIVEMHNGEIHFQSKPGEGTTFFFTILKPSVT